MEQSDNRQWVVWALMGSAVLLVACLACGVVIAAVVLLGLFTVPLTFAPSSSPAIRVPPPTDLDPDQYVELIDAHLDTLEEGNNLVRSILEEAQADPSVMDSQDWRDRALLAGTWFKTEQEIIASIVPPNGYIAAHQSVVDASDQCYPLYTSLSDPANADLEELADLVDACATSIENARTTIDNP